MRILSSHPPSRKVPSLRDELSTLIPPQPSALIGYYSPVIYAHIETTNVQFTKSNTFPISDFQRA